MANQQAGAAPGASPEPALPDLEELFNRVKRLPCQVLDVRRAQQKGADQRPQRTRQAIIDRELQRVYDAKTLQEIHDALEEAVTNLRQLDVFEEIEALIDSEPEVCVGSVQAHAAPAAAAGWRGGEGF